MIIFPIVIIVSITMYIYYKVAILRNNDELEQVYINSKSRIFLGIFISFFGINQYLYYQTMVALSIAIIFLFLGLLQIYSGYKRARHYGNERKKRIEP
ncbi:YtpI family protein [Aquibacillus salsiterrae]|uniref:YtpI family protein n=1 Tax=Aquibacillus salsiterrae TaxID=2950439 RepID=A0A9X3WAN1_9BACI|nr:YtpI family protein [Aquibacillus salsiterrae]MDC3415757.1 YtpI family protein [Aquibacillus salsiterrae]